MFIPWYVCECCSAECHSTGCPLPLPMDGEHQALDILGVHLLTPTFHAITLLRVDTILCCAVTPLCKATV